MLRLLALITALLSASDHWTTYLCLRAPARGYQVWEANPIAAWLFENLGLVQGLLLDSVLTLAALALLLTTRRLPHPVKVVFLLAVVAGTGYAVVNNLGVLAAIGVTPLGRMV